MGTAAGDKPAAVFAFPETYIDEALRTGGNDDHSLEYVLLDLMQKKPGELLRKDLKEAWKGGKGLFMPDGVKVGVWYSEEGIFFRRGMVQEGIQKRHYRGTKPQNGSKVFIKMDNLLQKNCRKKNLIRYGRE